MAHGRFVLFLTFGFFIGLSGCKTSSVSRVSGSNLVVTETDGTNPEAARMIAPYREKIEADMNRVLSYAPQTLDKSGRWQTPMGNFFADATLNSASDLMQRREGVSVDFCMLNAGGVRSIIPKGNVYLRTAYEIMPFENNLVVLRLGGAAVSELLAYIVSEGKPHPLSGITFEIRDGKAANVLINGKPFDASANYLVATNDYLYNGGDNMVFFKKASSKFDLDYKLRNVLIDRFEKLDTIKADTLTRIRPVNP